MACLKEVTSQVNNYYATILLRYLQIERKFMARNKTILFFLSLFYLSSSKFKTGNPFFFERAEVKIRLRRKSVTSPDILVARGNYGSCNFEP